MYFDQEAWIHPVEKTLKFVFIPKSIHPWYELVKKGAERAVTEYKKQGIRIEMSWDAPSTPLLEEHQEKIRSHSLNRPDGLAVACLAPATEIPLIDEAVKNGVNMFTFDTDAPHSLRRMYIGHANDYQDGYDLAEFLAEKMEYRGKVGLLSGTLAAPNHLGRIRGFREGLSQFSHIKIVFERADNDELEKAMSYTEEALLKHPDMKGFFCCNASNPIGCARVVKEAGKAGEIHIAGMDDMSETIAFMKEGVIDGIKMQRQWEIGYWAIEYMVAVNQGHTVPEEHAIDSVLITQKDIL